MTTKKNNKTVDINFHRPFKIYYVIKDVGEVYFGAKPKLKKGDSLFFTGLLVPTFADQQKVIYRLIPDDMPITAEMTKDEKVEYYRKNFQVLVPHINLRLSVYLQLSTNIKWAHEV